MFFSLYYTLTASVLEGRNKSAWGVSLNWIFADVAYLSFSILSTVSASDGGVLVFVCHVAPRSHVPPLSYILATCVSLQLRSLPPSELLFTLFLSD